MRQLAGLQSLTGKVHFLLCKTNELVVLEIWLMFNLFIHSRFKNGD